MFDLATTLAKKNSYHSPMTRVPQATSLWFRGLALIAAFKTTRRLMGADAANLRTPQPMSIRRSSRSPISSASHKSCGKIGTFISARSNKWINVFFFFFLTREEEDVSGRGFDELPCHTGERKKKSIHSARHSQQPKQITSRVGCRSANEVVS